MQWMRSETHNIKDLLKDIPKGGICVEIGTWIGESAVLLAKHFDQVVCVDHWDMGIEQQILDIKIYGCVRSESKAEFLKRTAPFKNVCHIQCNSVKAAKFFPDKSIKACYLDCDHS